MEKSIENFIDYCKSTLRIEHCNPETYSPLALAYIGDSIFDLMIKTMVVSAANKQSRKYHDEVSKIVCAPSQAKMMQGIKDSLTEAEHAIYKRGRNANIYSSAKNSSMSEYRNATAFEAVLGYLYLNEDFIRLADIVKLSLEVLNGNEDEVKENDSRETMQNDSLDTDGTNDIEYESDGSGD